MSLYDAVVIGTGGIGSAAVAALARRSVRVLGLDRFTEAHDRGSSHGQTRIIRLAYFEHPDYVPLLRSAYRGWAAVEDATGKRLFYPVGLLEIGPPDGVLLPGVLASAAQHGLSVERLTADQFRRHFPQLRIDDAWQAVWEREAGILSVEACVRAQLQVASAAGADLHFNEPAIEWQRRGRNFLVTTTKTTYEAQRLIITAGPWAPQLLAELQIGFRVLRKHLHWYRCGEARLSLQHPCPTFFYETDKGFFYGFPWIDQRGVKLSEHSGGTPVANVQEDDRRGETEDLRRVNWFRQQFVPEVEAERLEHTVCYYTMSPDEHFVVDLHPHHPGLALAAGLSGHGFKFSPVLGEILADFVLDGCTEHPVDFLRLDRPGLG